MFILLVHNNKLHVKAGLYSTTDTLKEDILGTQYIKILFTKPSV